MALGKLTEAKILRGNQRLRAAWYVLVKPSWKQMITAFVMNPAVFSEMNSVSEKVTQIVIEHYDRDSSACG